MSRFLACLFTILTAGMPLTAGEAAPTPLATVTIAGGDTVAQAWTRSLYGRLLAQPALAWFSLPEDPSAPWPYLRTAAGARSEVLIDANGRLCSRTVIVAGAQATAAAATIAAALGLAPVRMPGAEVAWTGAGPVKPMFAPGATVAAGRGLLALGDGMPARLSTPNPAIHHIEVDIQTGALAAALWPLATMQMAPAERPSPALAALIQERFVPKRIAIDLDLVPEGTRESATFAWSTAVRVLEPIDPGVLAALPADALALAAIGISGSRAWSAVADPIVDAVVAARSREKPAPTAKSILADIDARLAQDGAPGGLRTLVEGAGGTWAVAVVPAKSGVALVVLTPRSAVIDRIVEGWAVGATAARRLELRVGETPAWAVRQPGAWWISGDAALVPGRQHPALLGPLPAKTVAALAVDTAAVLRTAAPAIAGLNATGAAIAEAAARLAGPQRTIATAEAGSVVVDGRGPLGIAPLLVIAPTMILPAIDMVREAANTRAADLAAESLNPLVAAVLAEGEAGRQAPADLAALAPDLAADPEADWHPAKGRQGPSAFRYLRPVRIDDLDASVPVLIDDPALHAGLIVIAMGDGRVISIRGEAAARIWAAAGRKPAGASWQANEARKLLDGIALPP
ncbi:MAG: hypothetical protein RLZZ127_196 [Planctomycetota bacterium]|jgi:hypothetical protein